MMPSARKQKPSRQQLRVLARLADGYIEPSLLTCPDKVREALVSKQWIIETAVGYRLTPSGELLVGR